MHGSTGKPKSPFWALEGGRNVLPPHFALGQNRVGASLAAQDPIKCAQDAQRAPSGAPSPRWDRARRAGPFHVTWFTFGGGQIARGVTRPRRAIGATECGPRSLPGCASHPRQMQRAQTKEVVNVSLGDCTKVTFRADPPASSLGRGRCGVRVVAGHPCSVRGPHCRTRNVQGRFSCTVAPRMKRPLYM